MFPSNSMFALVFNLFAGIKGKYSPKEQGNLKDIYTTNFDDLNVRFVKVVAKYYGKLPEWHPAGSGYESMIFADEIIIK